jgi:hypothetical protein
MEPKINGGKLFLDGKEIKLENDNGILRGKIFVVQEQPLIVSGGNLHINGDFVHTFSEEEWADLKQGAKS